jgi:adenylylsulfate kinase
VEQGKVYSLFEKLVSREVREQKLGQHARVIWFTGLPSSGKTTLALALEKELFARGFFCQVLDGDNVRCGINYNLGFSNEDRLENIRSSKYIQILRTFRHHYNRYLITYCPSSL